MNTISSENKRRGDLWLNREVPGSLAVAGICLAMLGVVLLATQQCHIPLGGLKSTPLYISVPLTVGGFAVFAIASVILCCKWLEITNEELHANPPDKFYYSFTDKKFYRSNILMRKCNRTAVHRLLDGSCLMKSREELGKGMSKIAYKDTVISPDQRVCVRTVESTSRRNPHEPKIYQANSMLESPYVVKCLGILKDTPKKRVLVLEYCEKGELRNVYPNLSLKQNMMIFRDCLRGLGALHHAGYLHMDLHKGNILVTKDNQGKLADFGSARPLAELSTEPSAPNIWKFPLQLRLIAPELVRNCHNFAKMQPLEPISFKVDIWAIALTFSEILLCTETANKILSIQETLARESKRYFIPFPKFLNDEQAQRYQNALSDSSKLYEPVDKDSLEHLMWEMLHIDPEMRPTALQAAERLETLIEHMDG